MLTDLEKILMSDTRVSEDKQGGRPLSLLGDKQVDSLLVRNMLVANARASVLVPAPPA